MRDDETVLAQQSADLIRLRRAGLDESLADSVQREHGLLFNVLDRNKPHRGPCYGFADRLGISRVVLAAFHIRLRQLRRDQLYLMAE